MAPRTTVTADTLVSLGAQRLAGILLDLAGEQPTIKRRLRLELAGQAGGEIIAAEGEIDINAGRSRTTVVAVNTGDRPIQIGSHYHFFEANRALDFDREKTFGMHLDIPAGTAVRFEPGESKEVALVAFGGSGEVFGLNRLTDGSIRGELRRAESVRRARERGFKGA